MPRAISGLNPAQTEGQAFRFKAMEGSKEGGGHLYKLPCVEVSFTVLMDEELLAAVIESIKEIPRICGRVPWESPTNILSICRAGFHSRH